jgi:phenylalanyl-tRNA synthetase alpha subunit
VERLRVRDGLDGAATLKFDIPNLRALSENDLRVQSQF